VNVARYQIANLDNFKKSQHFMKKINYVLFVAFVLSIGCNDSIKARIDYRVDNQECNPILTDTTIFGDYSLEQRDANTKSAYLMNESNDKAYEYTIKTIVTNDDSLVNQTTTKIKLSPRDERRLGCTSYYDVLMYEDTTKSPKKHRIVLNYTCTEMRPITNSKELEDQK
jgi:hypothetical protein